MKTDDKTKEVESTERAHMQNTKTETENSTVGFMDRWTLQTQLGELGKEPIDGPTAATERKRVEKPKRQTHGNREKGRHACSHGQKQYAKR